MTANRFCISGMVTYVLLNLADLALTYLIIHRGIGYESNPVAAAWLHFHGWKGLAAFKLLSALVFGDTVAVISRYRPRTAAVLVGLGYAALLVVVVYSWRMLHEGERQAHEVPVTAPAASAD